MKYVSQRKKKLQMDVPGRDQGGLGIPKNASPRMWNAPPDIMTGSDAPRGRSASGNSNYGPTETNRRYNIAKG